MKIITKAITTMKKLFFSFILLLSPMMASAQTVSDVQNSGCLYETRGTESQTTPTIVLTKEGSILSMEVRNFISNCFTSDFVVKSSMSEGSDGAPCSLTVNVTPVTGGVLASCLCPYNVSFTVRDLKSSSFYLDCWWYNPKSRI